MGREVIVLKQNYKDPLDGQYKTKVITPDTDDTVHLVGDESIDGIKRFKNRPITDVVIEGVQQQVQVAIAPEVAETKDIKFQTVVIW